MFDLGYLSLTLALVAAFIVGFSKAGLPGSGILVVPLMAHAFGPRLSVGATLPLLIAGDICAVLIHREHVQWEHLKRLAPSVVTGLFVGTAFLLNFQKSHVLSVMIGSIVLLMLAITLLRKRLGDKLAPTSPVGIQVTGGFAGFTTMTANAAGPVMSIYMTAAGLTKQQLISTSAYYFFTFNLVKVPFLAYVTHARPSTPMFNQNTLTFDAAAAIVVAIGAFVGRKLFHVLPQELFSQIILALAAISSVWLIVSP